MGTPGSNRRRAATEKVARGESTCWARRPRQLAGDRRNTRWPIEATLLNMEFVVGANLPWFDYGLDFGANAWRATGGVGRPEARERVSRNLATLAQSGVQAVRWFLFCDGRAGICFDGGSQPSGLDDFVLRDVDAALGLAARERLAVMFVLLD